MRRQSVRRAIIQELDDGQSFSLQDLQKRLDYPNQDVRDSLNDLLDKGEKIRVGDVKSKEKKYEISEEQ